MSPANDTHPTRPATFDERVLAYMPLIRSSVRRYEFDPNCREDVVQDTVAAALHRWQSFREDGCFSTWLRLLAREMAGFRRRHEGRDIHTDERSAGCGNTRPEQEDMVMLGDAVETIVRVAGEDAADCILRTAIGESQEEIGARHGIKKAGVSMRISRARQMLAARFNRNPPVLRRKAA